MEIARHAPAATSDRSASVWLATLIAASLASDFFMVPVMGMIPALPIVAFPLYLACIGCLLAQGCLLAAWLAWSDQPFGQRTLRHWIVAAVLFLTWAAG